MGPSAIRYAGLDTRLARLGHECLDLGNVAAAVPEAAPVGDERARFLPEIKATCERVADLVAQAAADGHLPLVLGGDHSVALGSLAGPAPLHRPGGGVWVPRPGGLPSPGPQPRGNERRRGPPPTPRR